MKRLPKGIPALFAAGLFLFAFASCGKMRYAEGTQVERAQGYGGEIVVEVRFSHDRIEAIEVVESRESPQLGGAAFSALIPKMLEAQSANVDVQTGATVSSEALIAAVKRAIGKAAAQYAFDAIND